MLGQKKPSAMGFGAGAGGFADKKEANGFNAIISPDNKRKK